MFGRAVAIWLVLLVLAVLNGALREFVLHRSIGEQAGHIVSTVILCVLILLVAGLAISWIRPATAKDALLIGLFWVVLTVAFEFLAGHYLFGNPWQKLLADYNVIEGRIWFLVLLANLFSPLFAFKLGGS